jgi:hypothetical protein
MWYQDPDSRSEPLKTIRSIYAIKEADTAPAVAEAESILRECLPLSHYEILGCHCSFCAARFFGKEEAA